jgi:hypothetical protein
VVASGLDWAQILTGVRDRLSGSDSGRRRPFGNGHTPLPGDRHRHWHQTSHLRVGLDVICCNVGSPNTLSAKGNAEREGFEPSWRVSPPTAFPESVRSLTGSVWGRLLNTNETVEPTATDWLRLPVGIGVGIGSVGGRQRHTAGQLLSEAVTGV